MPGATPAELRWSSIIFLPTSGGVSELCPGPDCFRPEGVHVRYQCLFPSVRQQTGGPWGGAGKEGCQGTGVFPGHTASEWGLTNVAGWVESVSPCYTGTNIKQCILHLNFKLNLSALFSSSVLLKMSIWGSVGTLCIIPMRP